MGLKAFFKTLIGSPDEHGVIVDGSAAGGMNANPIAVNLEGKARLEHSEFRIGQIRRHIEQGGKISKQRLREFRAETLAHAESLVKAGWWNGEEHDAAVDFVMAAKPNVLSAG